MYRQPFALILLVAITAACGGSTTAPTEPGLPGAPAGASGASVTGTLRSTSGSPLTSVGTGSAMTGTVVSVSGTAITSTVDASGRFVLTNVPAGDLQLTFSGPVTATLSLTQVQAGETISLVISVAGGAITVESRSRSNGAEEQLEGKVEALPPGMPAGSLRVAGRTVTTDASTEIRQGNIPRVLGDFEVGYRVHVKGRTSGGSLLASSIFLQNDSTAPPEDGGDDGGEGQDSSASIHGRLTAIAGAAPTLTLTVGSTTVRTTAGTEVKRRGDVQSLAALQAGQELHVVGTRQSDGSLVARRIDISDDPSGGAFEIEGSAGGVSGTCPALTFSVNGFRVRTTASTTFEGVTCAAFKSGTKVTVNGTVEAGGDVLATRVRGK